MKNKLFALVLGTLMTFFMVACGGKKEEIPEYVTAVGPVMSDELSSGQFYLDGDLYQFPLKVEDFLENGYGFGANVRVPDNFKLSPGGQSSTFFLVKEVDDDVHGLRCRAYNPTDEELPLRECMLGLISIDAPADMMFPGGIWERGKYEAVISAYGEPRTFDNNSDTIYTLVYDITMEDGSKWEVKFMMNNFKINMVTYTLEGMELD